MIYSGSFLVMSIFFAATASVTADPGAPGD